LFVGYVETLYFHFWLPIGPVLYTGGYPVYRKR